jgi:hypothetical protein
VIKLSRMESVLADAPTTSQDALHIEGHGVTLAAFQETVNGTLGALERFWFHTLDWLGDHPFQFSIMAALFAWWLYQRRAGSVARLR